MRGTERGSGRVAIINTDNSSRQCSVRRKNSMVQIRPIDGDFTCAARAIVVCMAKLEGPGSKDYKTLIRGDTDKSRLYHKDKALKLLRAVGISDKRPVRVIDLVLFERYLKTQIVVVSGDNGCEIIYKGLQDMYKSKIFLYLKDEHFHSIVNIKGFFYNKTICLHCLETYPKKSRKHFCRESCTTCVRPVCVTDASSKTCQECNAFCRNEQCYDSHKQPRILQKGPNKGQEKISRCENFFTCPQCRKVIDCTVRSSSKHRCGEWFCKTCSTYVEGEHLCYYKCTKPKVSSGRFLIYDFETNQSDRAVSCKEGYSPTDIIDCLTCSVKIKCQMCRKCKNCKTSYCGLQRHIPNYVVCHSVCDLCKDSEFFYDSKCHACGDRCSLCSTRENQSFKKPPCVTCGNREKIFSGFDTLTSFGQWLISSQHEGMIVLAHNSKNFDSHFILNYCVENGIFPDIVFQGTKIMSMAVKEVKMRFVDTINFLPFSLKKVATSFNLKHVKGYFPHMSNTQAMEGYVGPMPPPEKYGIEYMSTQAKKEFLSWYSDNKHKEFDFDQTLKEYTRDDCNILRQATMVFRDMIKEITTLEGSAIGGIDVFCFNTIASSAMHIIRTLTMYEEHNIDMVDGSRAYGIFTKGKFFINGREIDESLIKATYFVKSPIPQIPARGYCKQYKDSEFAIIWLEYIAKKTGKDIKHSRNSGEQKIPGTRYLVDGYCEITKDDGSVIKEVYEYLGCFWHACPLCIPNRTSVKDPRTGTNLQKVYDRTMTRLKTIEDMGYSVETMWECQFKQQLGTSQELKTFAQHCNVPKPLCLKDAFSGGRCETMKMLDHAEEGERIRYLDVISLYPTSVLDPLPTCHPEILSDARQFDYTLESYKLAIIKASVAAPRELYIPVLGLKINNRFKFALCRTCAEKDLKKQCKCSYQERLLTGTWTSLELKEALIVGYILDTIFQVYNYPETSGDPWSYGSVFDQYIKIFMAIKAEASGYPPTVISEQEKDDYVENFRVVQGIKLNKNKIESNPPLRLIAKLYLNSVWGKFVQRLDLAKTCYVKTKDQLALIRNDNTKKILDFHLVTENFVAIEYTDGEHFIEDPVFQNLVYGIFTTSIARVRLLKYLQKTDRRTIYTDTDSIIFKEKIGETILEVGDLMGDLSDELPSNQHISSFCSTGPKSYSYILSPGTTGMSSGITKVKGITLNWTNDKLVHFQSIKALVLDQQDKITLPTYNQISRVKHHGIVYNKPTTKIFRKIFTKRAAAEHLDTFPYGF